MVECTECNVCNGNGKYENTQDSRDIACNVRAFQHEVFTVWRCPSCGSLHCKQPIDAGRYYRSYPVKSHTLDFWARTAYTNYLRRLTQVKINQASSVLDYGCGPGLLVEFLKQSGFQDVAGFDAHVPKFSNKAALDRTYDLVITQDVIEHVDNPREWLESLVQLLNPEGIICIGTPNAAEIDLSQADTFALSLHQPYHRHLLSYRALIAMAEKAGLKAIAQHDRFYYDTLYPTVNYRFLRAYVRRAGNLLDAAFEKPHLAMVLTSPKLWFLALFGYFFPPRSEMMILFRKNSGA